MHKTRKIIICYVLTVIWCWLSAAGPGLSPTATSLDYAHTDRLLQTFQGLTVSRSSSRARTLPVFAAQTDRHPYAVGRSPGHRSILLASSARRRHVLLAKVTCSTRYFGGAVRAPRWNVKSSFFFSHVVGRLVSASSAGVWRVGIVKQRPTAPLPSRNGDIRASNAHTAPKLCLTLLPSIETSCRVEVSAFGQPWITGARRDEVHVVTPDSGDILSR